MPVVVKNDPTTVGEGLTRSTKKGTSRCQIRVVSVSVVPLVSNLEQ